MTVNRPTPCIGYDDAQGTHHKCERPDLSTNGKGSGSGRCASCANHQRMEARFASRMRELNPTKSIALHPRHVTTTTAYTVACANCGSELLTGSIDALQGFRGRAFDCARCGASWHVTDDTLAEVAA